MTLPDFVGFPKIARLSRDCVVTEKLDGTNAQVCVLEDGRILAGSRTRWITPDNDNFGFARWVEEHCEELRTLGPGQHFGEWWGYGIQRNYGLLVKRWSLFNVIRWCLAHEVPGVVSVDAAGVPKYQKQLPECCSLVPVLYRGPFTSEACNTALDRLRCEGSRAAPGFMEPEGIVILHTAARTLFKKTLVADEAPKGLNP
jgi:hypothetical protein